MFYIGIDIGKYNHFVSVINQDGEVLVKPFSFQNNQDGFNSFLLSVKKFMYQRHIVGLESTGHYGDNLLLFLLDHNFEVGLINPIITDAERKKKIRKTKNDKIDSLLICNVLVSKDFTRITKQKLLLREMKQLTRYHASLNESLNQHKNRLQVCIDIVFPEFNSLFKSKYSRPYMALLEHLPSARIIANTHATRLKSIVSTCGKGRSISLSVSNLKACASTSVGESNDVISLEITQLIQTIKLIKLQLSTVDKKIKEFALNSNSPIYSIPGISAYSGTSILSEIGDISYFCSPSKIVAFAGLDPAVYQSGQYNAEGTSISKRGSPYLRKVLYQVALPLCRTDSTFHTYYNYKRKQGKAHRCAQGHVIRKLIRVIFKLLSENIEFNSELLK